jgi:hypothetical protein
MLHSSKPACRPFSAFDTGKRWQQSGLTDPGRPAGD